MRSKALAQSLQPIMLLDPTNIETDETMIVSTPKLSILSMLACAMFAMPSNADASQSTLILQHANELNCAGDEMRDEIKTHFRKARYYGKMLATSAQIRGRSAAVVRRVKRNPEYRGLCRDVAKLEKLTCELNSLYRETILRIQQGKDRPIFEDTCHVLDLIENMQELSNCMILMAKGEVIVVEEIFIEPATPLIQSPRPISNFPTIVPNNEIAPSVPGTIEFHSPQQIQMNRPLIQDQRATMGWQRSVV